MLDARQIAVALGGKVTGRNTVSAPGPGHSKTDMSLSIKIEPGAPDGFVVYSHASGNGNDPISCKDYVRTRLGLEQWKPGQGPRPWKAAAAPSELSDDEKRRGELVARIWRQSVDPRGTMVEAFLRDQRGLNLPAEIALTVVRFHGSLFYDGRKLPGMVCLLRKIVDDEPVAIHRTFFERDGTKIDRRMLGPAKGAAIKIDADANVIDALTVGEGFETSLAARAAGLGPAWALGSAGAIGAFPVLDRVNTLTLLEERDATSRRVVKKCGQRYVAAKRTVNIITPKAGKDFNDVWLEARNGRA